jgi:hypothetical protein
VKNTNFSNNIESTQNYSILLWHESDPWSFELQIFLCSALVLFYVMNELSALPKLHGDNVIGRTLWLMSNLTGHYRH